MNEFELWDGNLITDFFSVEEFVGTEDSFFTRNISKCNIEKEFGWGYSYYENYNQYGFPTMCHYFQIKDYGKEWCNEFIGDWDNDLQGCIEYPNFIKMGLLEK